METITTTSRRGWPSGGIRRTRVGVVAIVVLLLYTVLMFSPFHARVPRSLLLSSRTLIPALKSFQARGPLPPPPVGLPPTNPFELHPTLVGPRIFQDLYPPHVCDWPEFLKSIEEARILPDGKSLEVNYTQRAKHETTELPPFEWSFKFPPKRGCPQPHVFTPEEACDLLSAFGGIYFVGDSFVRHLMTAMLMLLRGRLDGAVVSRSTGIPGDSTRGTKSVETCLGETMFDDGKQCRERLTWDTRIKSNQICGGESNMYLSFASRLNNIHIEAIPGWINSLPRSQRVRSPVIVQGHGVHDCYRSPGYLEYFTSLLHLAEGLFPSPINLWAGAHHPGVNQPPAFVPLQGPEAAKAWNQEIQGMFRNLAGDIHPHPDHYHHQQHHHHLHRGPPTALTTTTDSSREERSVERGSGFGFIPFYNITDGASSFDGVHYSYQVNMEKAHILLNLLDILWGKISRAGGLIVLQ